jgi:hypothetical protein
MFSVAAPHGTTVSPTRSCFRSRLHFRNHSDRSSSSCRCFLWGTLLFTRFGSIRFFHTSIAKRLDTESIRDARSRYAGIIVLARFSCEMSQPMLSLLNTAIAMWEMLSLRSRLPE